MKKFITKFHREEEAATVVEYAVMLALIVTVCLQLIILNGNEIRIWWDNIDNDMGNAINN